MVSEFKPIGIVRCELKELKEVPFYWKDSEVEGEIEVFEEFKDGLKGIGRFPHLAVIFLFHKSKGYQLIQLARDGEIRGVFATGSPFRPNPIGLSILKVLKVEDNILYVKWLDMIDGTPVLDIKPFHLDEIKKEL
jgi:tRNA-Thr(GGU) m(6)t(6)A37 methyltransferase TsaA